MSESSSTAPARVRVGVYKAVDDDDCDQARFPVMTREDPRATREGTRVRPLGYPADLTTKEDHR